MGKTTHYDIIREISNEGWDFNQQFLRALLHCRAEKKDKHPIAYVLGADVEETGKYFCPDCDSYLTEPVCHNFESVVRNTLKREVIKPYMQKTCPDCYTSIEEMDYVRERVGEPQVFSSIEEIEEPQMVEFEDKRRYKPCGCLFEVGEEKIRWDIDKEKAENEIGLLRYDGPVFNS